MMSLKTSHAGSTITLLLACCSFMVRTSMIPAGVFVDAFQGREIPSTVPTSPGTALFVAHFLVNTEINQMLDMADELSALGHESQFVVSTMYADNVRKRGYPVVAETPDMSKMEPWWSNWQNDNMAQGIPARSWSEYFRRSIKNAFQASSELYEPSLVILKDHLEARPKLPDVIVASFFSDMAFDLARYHDIPLAVSNASPLGSIFNYEDVPACPSGLYWGSLQDYQSFWYRFQKFIIFGNIMSIAIPMSFRLNAIRDKHGLPPVNDPMEVLNRATWIVGYPFGIEFARKLRPLTKVVGFITQPYQPPRLEGAEMSPSDQKLEQLLDQHSDGVVYAAFGSLAYLTQEWFDGIIQGMSQWANDQTSTSPNKNNAMGIIAIKEDNRRHLNVAKIPDNVQLLSWTNQKMILAHAHTKAFITHAGQGSLAEGVHNQVPMLAFPLFADQFTNGQKIVEAGIGAMINQRVESFISAAKVAESLGNITSNPTIMENLNRHYQISARMGGAKAAAAILEDMIVFGHLDHLIPLEEKSSFVANTNADIYGAFLLLLAVGFYGVKTMIKKLMGVVGRKVKQA